MADFCKQCSLKIFNEDCGDLAGIGPRKLTNKEIFAGVGWACLCEGCGPTVVTDFGECISHYCLKRHGAIKPTIQ